MAQPPEKSPTAETGSNVGARAALLEHDQRATERRIEPLVRLREEAANQRAGFLTEDVLHMIDGIAQSSRDAFNRALLGSHGDGEAIARARDEMRATNRQALAQQIPGFSAFQVAQISNARAHAERRAEHRAATVQGRVNLDLGTVPIQALDEQRFVAPYPLFDVASPGVGELVRADGTFADPRLGIVLNQLRYDNDDHDPLFGFSNSLGVASNAAVGVNCTMQRSGRMAVSAVVQNIYNYVTFSLTDNFGWSDGEMHFRVLLFMRILRGGQVIAFDRLICERGLQTPGGVDLHGVSFDDIEMSTPYTLTAVTDDTFAAGETVQILVGSRLEIDDSLNDMQARLNGTLGWQVEQIVVSPMAP